MDTQTVIGLAAGDVSYSIEDAAVSISELIGMLEQAQEEGATHVVGFSGNYRGAQYVTVATDYEWVEER